MKDLTICIPTFKRLPFLEWTLTRTLRDFPGTSIVVSNNNHGDGVQDYCTAWPDLTYVGQEQNIGAFPNMRAALLAGDTKYAVFLADDDYLVPEQVAKGIEYLEANPDVVAYFAPCQLYDEMAITPAWNAFYPGTDEKFTRGDLLWQFLIKNHVWPEHAIYRREHLDKIMKPRVYAYWCFVDLANAVKVGPVYFAKEPYYRNITRHPVGGRVKLGDQQCLTDFDYYRAGLEVLAYDLFAPYLGSQPELLFRVQLSITAFIWMRIEVAHRILKMQGQTALAAEYYKRLAISKPLNLEMIPAAPPP